MNVRELQHLAAAMAHEVRNPLNSMAIHVELLESRLKKADGEAREQALKSAAVLAQEIERVDKILEEYLQFAGPSEANRKLVDPGKLIEEAAARARGRAGERGIELTVERRGELGSWLVDEEALADAIDQLIANALEASPKGSAVAVAARADEDQAEVTVTDEGDGIAEADVARVFHLGFSRRGRPGVGLAVAKQIVKGHGGSLTVKRRSERGTVFTIRLPLEAEA